MRPSFAVGRARLVSIRCFAILLALAVVPSLAWSQYSAADAMVTRSLRGRDVLRVQSVLEAPHGGPTGVAKISVTAAKPSPTDRDLVIVLYIESYGSSDESNTAYRAPVRLEEGKTSVDLELVYVNSRGQAVWDVGIFEQGRDIEDKRGRRQGANWAGTSDQPAVIAGLIGSQESDSLSLPKLEDFAEEIKLDTNQARVAGIPLAQVYPAASASSDWRFYFSRPLWVISPAALTEVNANPAVAQALRKYVAASGLLVIHSIQDASQLAEVESLLEQPAAENAQRWTTDYSAQQGRLVVKSAEYLEKPDAAVQNHPILRQYGFGNVLVTSDPLEELKGGYWHSTLSPLTQPTLVAPDMDGDWFWRNLIRAVGKPPVWMFCGIVALFGAVLGPGLLVVTGRMARRSLMIFLVPAISLLATLAIVSYGVLHEGFETYVRVTSVQAIDTPTKQGFIWSRQNFFSGLPPRDGLNLSRQTYARGVAAESSGARYRWDGDPRRGVDTTVTMLPDKQNLGGWLRPRQQQQLLIGHPATFSQLPIEVIRRGPAEIEVKNVADYQLPAVVLRGKQHDYYVAQQLAPNQSLTLRADGREIVRAKVAKLMVDYRPASPPELGEGGSLLDFGSGSRRYTTQNNFYELDDILNAFFRQWMSDKLELPPFGFAILSTQSDMVEVPLQGSSAENLHLIVGTQAW